MSNTTYKAEYAQMLIDYFDVEPYKTVKRQRKTKYSTFSEPVKIANPLPKFHIFAKSIGTTSKTLIDWDKRGKALKGKSDLTQEEYNLVQWSESYTRAKELLKWFIATNALEGIYDMKFSQFLLSNITDWKITQRVESEVTDRTGVQIFIPKKEGLAQATGGNLPGRNEIKQIPKVSLEVSEGKSPSILDGQVILTQGDNQPSTNPISPKPKPTHTKAEGKATEGQRTGAGL